jgi:hypothetical protein
MTTKYEVTIKFLVEDDVPEEELNNFLGELQAPADDPSIDAYVYSVGVKWTNDRGESAGSAHGKVIPAEVLAETQPERDPGTWRERDLL